MTVTIYDVAQAAGVGISTVSRVLNESSNVRQETRQRVLDAIETLGYKPNLLARNLSRIRVRTVGVMLSYLTSPFQVAVLRGIEKALSAAGFDLVIYSLDSQTRRDVLLESLSRGGRTDGLIVVSFAPPAHLLRHFQRSHIPIVAVDFYSEAVPSVYVDNVHGGFLAASHLLAKGHTRIGYVQDYAEDPNGPGGNRPAADRLRGYKQALAQAGIPFDPALVALSEGHTRRCGVAAAAELLDRPEPPTAIFACSDMLALGVLEYARSHGVDVPGQLAVVGFDDIELASFAGLTTVRQPMGQLGRLAAEIMIATLEGTPPEEEHVLLPLELVIRSSSGCQPEAARMRSAG